MSSTSSSSSSIDDDDNSCSSSDSPSSSFSSFTEDPICLPKSHPIYTPTLISVPTNSLNADRKLYQMLVTCENIEDSQPFHITILFMTSNDKNDRREKKDEGGVDRERSYNISVSLSLSIVRKFNKLKCVVPTTRREGRRMFVHSHSSFSTRKLSHSLHRLVLLFLLLLPMMMIMLTILPLPLHYD